ncbi:type II toxin-antitoxin system death-on-curing family toxin [Candidatus Woesearchaeota archaeon]|nr:type II toxin-antitoxin system death-on-curing family toxin [Candidatus Woesearchaeota archaeon]
MIKYPTIEDVIVANQKVLEEVKVKKADAHKVLSQEKIKDVLVKVAGANGDLFDKSVVLLKGIIQAHAFASGNRRTAFVVVENFLYYNNEKSEVTNQANAYILQGIREGYYSDEEIKKWLKTGEIHEFKRK